LDKAAMTMVVTPAISASNMLLGCECLGFP